MTMRFAPAIGALAAALLLGGEAFAQEPAAPVETPTPVEASANPDSEEASGEEEESTAFLNSWLLGDAFTEKTGISISGWAAGGAAVNDNASTRMGPVTFANEQDFMLNQLYLIIGRAVDKEGCDIDWGFQVDALYGTDARFTQALGLDTRAGFDPNILELNNSNSGTYSFALPQLYGEMFFPVGGGLTVSVGHFYTLIGYEVVTAPNNFFYTHSYTMQYGEPFTHTGVMTRYGLTDSITVHNCILRGWDNWSDNNNAVSYLGGATWSNDKTSITLNFITGAEQDEPNVSALSGGAGFQFFDDPAGRTMTRNMYSLVVTQKIGEKLTYVFQHDYGAQNSTATGLSGGAPFGGAQWYGVNNYLLYDINDKLAAGLRAEWFRDDDGVRVFNQQTGAFNATSYYEVTVGLNWKPTAFLTVRPELRWDWQDDVNSPLGPAYGGFNGDGSFEPRMSQFMAAMDVILKF